MNRFIIILTLAIATVFVACNSNTKNNFISQKEIFTPKEASEILKGNALLIDVRNPEEVVELAYDAKSVINLPLDSLQNHFAEIPKDRQVIVACRSGKRSAKAFELLKENGFVNIANMEGGMIAWEEAGLQTKTAGAACCADPDSPDCNPDGTCKTPGETNTVAASDLSKDHLEVFAFHGTRQCETCKNMKANTKATLDKYFAEQVKNGTIVFSIIDVDDAKNEKLAEKFQATGTALMANKVVNGKDNIVDWSDFAFDKANDAEVFIPELKTKIEAELK